MNGLILFTSNIIQIQAMGIFILTTIRVRMLGLFFVLSGKWRGFKISAA